MTYLYPSPLESLIGNIASAQLLKKVRLSSPVIIVGMHRSGTSLLSRMVEKAGYFFGRHKTGNNESFFFQQANARMLDVSGCNWRHLESFPPPDKLGVRKWPGKIALEYLDKGLAMHFWGTLALKAALSGPGNWGWKDPRNSLLLPIWLDIFPNARVLHIHRDQRDAALSLLTRDRKKKPGMSDDVRNSTYMKYIELQKAYEERIAPCLPQGRSYSMQYETLIAAPLVESEKLLAFLGTEDCPAQDLADMVDTGIQPRYAMEENSWTKDLL